MAVMNTAGLDGLKDLLQRERLLVLACFFQDVPKWLGPGDEQPAPLVDLHVRWRYAEQAFSVVHVTVTSMKGQRYTWPVAELPGEVQTVLSELVWTEEGPNNLLPFGFTDFMLPKVRAGLTLHLSVDYLDLPGVQASDLQHLVVASQQPVRAVVTGESSPLPDEPARRVEAARQVAQARYAPSEALYELQCHLARGLRRQAERLCTDEAAS